MSEHPSSENPSPLDHPNDLDDSSQKDRKLFALKEAQSIAKEALDFGKTLKDKVKSEVDPKKLAQGIVGMTAGEGIGSAIGGVIGSVGGPIGSAVGAHLGAVAGGSIGSKYGYEWEQRPATEETPPGNAIIAPELEEDESELTHLLRLKSAHLAGGELGKGAGELIGETLGGGSTRTVMNSIGETLGSALGESAIDSSNKPHESESYRKIPTRAWLKNVAKEKMSETALSGIFGGIGQMILGPIGGRIGSKAGAVASSRIKWPDQEPRVEETESPLSPDDQTTKKE